jgi:hypothetical protein
MAWELVDRGYSLNSAGAIGEAINDLLTINGAHLRKVEHNNAPRVGGL